MHDRTEWTRGTANEVKVKNRTYKNLVEFSRPCATCEKPFSIFVTKKIADGHADSNSFGLKNCPDHRRNKPIGEAGDAVQMANNTMKEELAGLYARDKAMFAEIQELKARLAKYELGPAMAAQAEGVTHPMEPMPREQVAKLYGFKAQNKLPWE